MYQAILIEDEQLIRYYWESSAKRRGKKVLALSGLDEFYALEEKPSIHTPVFIDMELGRNMNGLEVAKQLSILGYQSLYISTSYDAEFINAPVSLIRGVISKDPPEWIFENSKVV